ncbi:hypothetical protein JY97_14095 [Alkalispirochaeta odontotermitis]|nr:hypothetical protein JY97_14095 [Alkalispirochaeta odontotermitis]
MYGPMNAGERVLIARLPSIRRARGYYLYALDGNRWLDCWVEGGRALLGHRPKGVSHRLKNEIDKGLYSPYPNKWLQRLKLALMRLFPGYVQVRIYQNFEQAILNLKLKEHPIDPLDLSAESIPTVLWGRPLLPEHPRAEYLFPILPLPGLSEAQPVLISSNSLLPAADSHPISPVILAALTRSCTAVSYWRGAKKLNKQGGISTVISGTDKIPWPSISTAVWKRRGPYLSYRGKAGEYVKLFEYLFVHKILIAPSHDRPSLLFPGASRKEITLLGGKELDNV